MASSRLHNALLFVIALCLVLLVVHFYSGHVVSKAQAQTGGSAAYLYGCKSDVSGECKWIPIKADGNGNILTRSGMLAAAND